MQVVQCREDLRQKRGICPSPLIIKCRQLTSLQTPTGSRVVCPRMCIISSSVQVPLSNTKNGGIPAILSTQSMNLTVHLPSLSALGRIYPSPAHVVRPQGCTSGLNAIHGTWIVIELQSHLLLRYFMQSGEPSGFLCLWLRVYDIPRTQELSNKLSNH